MARYEVNHNYRSYRDGQSYGPWEAGDIVDLDDDAAAWLERDSPGLLRAPKAERAQPPAKDRQHRGAANRSG